MGERRDHSAFKAGRQDWLQFQSVPAGRGVHEMNRNHQSAAAALLLGLATTAWGQYTGPGARAPAAQAAARTVAEALQAPVDDRPVELAGSLVRQTGRELFLFRDATGEITVEIDAEDFPAGQPVGPEARVQIRGEIETRLLRKPRIEVEHLQLATAAAQ
jgi:uncharacterized protein (TIGR00156 family)